MMTSNYARRLQASLNADLTVAAGITLNQFINVAVAKKIAALKTVNYLKLRAARGCKAEALKILEQASSSRAVQAGDEVWVT